MDTTHNKTPETFKVTGDWSIQSKQLKNKFTTLTDADLKFEKGKEGELISRVANRLKKKNSEVVSIFTNNQAEKK